MPVAQVLQLMSLLLAQVIPAVQAGRDTIEVEALGDEHRAALEELRAYLDNLDDMDASA